MYIIERNLMVHRLDLLEGGTAVVESTLKAGKKLRLSDVEDHKKLLKDISKAGVIDFWGQDQADTKPSKSYVFYRQGQLVLLTTYLPQAEEGLVLTPVMRVHYPLSDFKIVSRVSSQRGPHLGLITHDHDVRDTRPAVSLGHGGAPADIVQGVPGSGQVLFIDYNPFGDLVLVQRASPSRWSSWSSATRCPPKTCCSAPGVHQ